MVNITDAIAIVNYIMRKSNVVFLEEKADVNQDGEINFTDVLSLMNMIMNKDAVGSRSTSKEEIIIPM